jgi:nucleotide-binding universal stress UspA family protein
MYKSILLPIDLDHSSSWQKAMPVALDLAKSLGAKLHVVSVVPDFKLTAIGVYLPDDFETKAVEHCTEKLEEFVADNVPEAIRGETRVAHGHIAQEILNFAEALDCDLIVMAPHRPEMKDFFISPSTSSVVRRADRSVLIVRE